MPDDEQQPPSANAPVDSAVVVEINGANVQQNGDHIESHARDDSHGDSPRPNKRRKLTDSLTPQQQPSPRAVSPPWKRFSAEGPTTFLDSGKRRSGRTNTLPLDLRPTGNKRRTRAAVDKTNGTVHSRYSSTPAKKVEPKYDSSAGAKSSSKHARTISRSSQVSGNLSALKSRRQSSLVKRESSPPTPTSRVSKRGGKSKSNGYPPRPQSSRKVGRPPSRLAGRGSRPRPENGRVKAEEDEDMSEDAMSDSALTSNPSDDDEVEDYVPDPSAKLQKLKFNIRKPTLPLPSYGNTPQFARDTRQQWTKRQFDSMDDWLDWMVASGHQVFPGYDIYEGDEEYLKEAFEDSEERRRHRELSRRTRGPVPRYTRDEARDEAELREEVERALTPGGKLHPDSCTQLAPEKFELKYRQYGHWDHMLAHMVNFRKLMTRETKVHREAAKRLAYAAQERWKSIQPKTQEEIAEEKQETELAIVTATFRQCLKDLASKFDTFRAELHKIRMARWQEEQEALGKKALNKVMEKSALLLDARRRMGSSALGSETEESGDEDGDDLTDSDDASGSNSNESDGNEEGEEENMSSEDAESEVADEEGQGDEGLTAEELKQKYGAPQTHAPDRPAEYANDVEDVTMFDHDQDEDTPAALQSDGSEVEDDTAVPMQIDEITQQIYEEAAEESDESIDMSEEDSSDDGDEESDGSDDEEDEDEDLGLLSLIATKDQLKEAKIKSEGVDSYSKHQAEPPHHVTVNGHFQLDDEEELEEVSLIPDSSTMRESSVVPDAAQVQTPAASHDEIGPEITRSDSHTERPTNLSFVTTSSPPPVPDEDEVEPDHASERQVSLPATPVSSNGIKTPVPSLLRATLREYQHYGLDWLAGLYAKDTNGILADEMGLGKTIQTISLFAHIAEVHGIWGPHLVVVPTSVMLNWEVEFKKFLPGFKVLVYYGTPEERKAKRRGWMDDDKWNVVITSYQLVLQDAVSFKHRSWHYLVLDEAHNIKNWKSARWQTLLGFRTSHRLLLTGTPLQNNLTELWSLMFFLMPYSEDESGQPQFTGLEEFTSWFNKPVSQIMEQGRGELTDEARELVHRLHTILRPYLLRRLKADVEKQMPGKYEHVVYCKLSKRQRYLYDGFMSRASTRETLSGGNYLSIINCLMQLRKVCNHPDLFETRQIVTSFAMPKSATADYEIKELLVRKRLLHEEDSDQLSLKAINLLPAAAGRVPAMRTVRKQRLAVLDRFKSLIQQHQRHFASQPGYDGTTLQSSLDFMLRQGHRKTASFLDWQWHLQKTRSQEMALLDHQKVDFIRRKLNESRTTTRHLTLAVPQGDLKVLQYIERKNALPLPLRPSGPAEYSSWLDYSTPILQSLQMSLQQRAMAMKPCIERFGCITPTVVAQGIDRSTIGKPGIQIANSLRPALTTSLRKQNDPFHESQTRLSIAFPDKRLLQYDCGKLQRLDALLRNLQAGGHRALIFTQMTKVLDILEQFLNIHGHRYLRLDGSTKIEQRQILTDRFNSDTRILAFILSSRSGGLGINLTGADTVIFYDLDWNPAMDKQCQDRAHRIGQTRDVHIYRFVSEYTIEANILRKANQKRLLDDVIIQDGDFTTDHFAKPNPRDMSEDEAMHEADAEANAAMDRILGAGPSGDKISTKLLAHAEDKEDIQAAAVAEKEGHADDADFNEKSGAPTGANTPRSLGPNTPNVHQPGVQRRNTEIIDGDEDAEFFTGTVQPRTEAGWQIFGEKVGIGVDRYIQELLEWELKDVPVVPPEERSRKKKGRKTEQYSTKRRR